MYHGKVDLHLHLDGSLSEAVVSELTAKAGFPMSMEEIRHNLRVPPECTSLVEYLQRFELSTKVLQTPYALELSAYDLLSRLAAQGLIYTEIRFAPQLHTRQGMSQKDVVRSVLRGLEQAQHDHPSIRAGLLLCALTDGKENRQTFDVAKELYGQGVVGVDLAGAEGILPLDTYTPLFEEMLRERIPFTFHAGECGSAENVRHAVELGARRIGHGCGALKSESCMELLLKNHITVEMCIVSNLQTKAVASLESHPIRPFFDRGIAVTVNTDNMSCSDTTLEREHTVIESAFHFTDEEFLQMDRNAIRGAFLSEADKTALLGKLTL